MTDTAAFSESEYQRIFEEARNNTLQIERCRFNARIARADGESTEVTEIRGAYVARLGTYRYQKAPYDEVELLLHRYGHYSRYEGEDWRDLVAEMRSMDLSKIPGIDVHNVLQTFASEAGHEVPPLCAIPMFADLAEMTIAFSAIKTKAIGGKLFHVYTMANTEPDTSTIYYIAAEAPEYILWIDESDYTAFSEDDGYVELHFRSIDGPQEDQQPAVATPRRESWVEVTTAVAILRDVNDPQIQLPAID